MHNLLKRLLKTLGVATVLVVVVSIIATIYSFVDLGYFFIDYLVTANFAVGGLVIAVGLLNYMLPTRLGQSKLIDHTTYAERKLEAREAKRKKSYEFLYVGIAVIAIAGTAEMLHWWIAR